MTEAVNQSTLNLVLACALTAVTALVGWGATSIIDDVKVNAIDSREADAALLEAINAFRREVEHRLTLLEAHHQATR